MLLESLIMEKRPHMARIVTFYAKFIDIVYDLLEL